MQQQLYPREHFPLLLSKKWPKSSITNTLYYSLVGVDGNKGTLLRGALLGGIAGVGAVLAPEPLGLGKQPSARTPATQVMTIAWYVIGGLAAAATWQRFGSAGGETQAQ